MIRTHFRMDVGAVKEVSLIWHRETKSAHIAAMNYVLDFVMGIILKRAPRVTGKLRSSIKKKVDASAFTKRVTGEVYSDLYYAQYVEKGSKPAYPPRSKIIDWLILKFGMSEKMAKKRSYGVIMKISKEGITPQWFFRNTYDTTFYDIIPMYRAAFFRNFRVK